MTDAPKMIHLLPVDAKLFDQKYGHPNVTQVMVGDPFETYHHEGTVKALQAKLAEVQINAATMLNTNDLEYNRKSNDLIGRHAEHLTTLSDRAEAAQARIAELTLALVQCREEIDGYIWQEYPSDEPLVVHRRNRGLGANPARAALEAKHD
jgi:hypothetical protein